MTTTIQTVVPARASTQLSVLPLTAVNLDALAAKQLVRTMVQQAGPPSRLLVDCGTLRALRTLGISHVVSELLVLRQGGAQVWLRNVSPVLQQCLRALRLDQAFFLAD